MVWPLFLPIPTCYIWHRPPSFHFLHLLHDSPCNTCKVSLIPRFPNGFLLLTRSHLTSGQGHPLIFDCHLHNCQDLCLIPSIPPDQTLNPFHNPLFPSGRNLGSPFPLQQQHKLLRREYLGLLTNVFISHPSFFWPQTTRGHFIALIQHQHMWYRICRRQAKQLTTVWGSPHWPYYSLCPSGNISNISSVWLLHCPFTRPATRTM